MAQNSSHQGRQNGSQSQQLSWIESIKVFALAWIFLNHIVERLFGYPYIANPFAGWPPLADRLAQLQPVTGHGVWEVPLNLLRYAGWAGDQGVQLFLIVSGFGLTWSALSRYGDGPLDLRRFYWRRAERIYPLWCGVHVLFVVTWLMVGWGLSATDPATYLSLLGIRITPSLLYYFSPAWWYVGLLIQLYLVYPLLWRMLRLWGPLWTLVVSCAVAFAARAVGALLLEGALDAWLRGALFITRLPEFVLGISLAAWLHRAPERTDRRLRAPGTLIAAAVSYVVGTALALTLLGMSVAPLLLGAGAFVLLYALFNRGEQHKGVGLRAWIGAHSYSLYLMHHPLILLLLPAGPGVGWQRALAGTIAALVGTVAGAIVLEKAVNGTRALLQRGWKKLGPWGLAVRFGVACAIIALLLVGTELLVRRLDPQEVLGWGERPSLEPHPVFGWRLKPDSQARLRWESYDYWVSANSLGYPGPEYPQQKEPGTLRVLVVGDAFTSAEGVDTDQAWPRLLEADLAARLPERKVEVLNFAITGYGPNQYAAVVETFVPLYQPDLILIGFFVNDYLDVQWSDQEFRDSIGFGLPAQDGWYAVGTLSHLRQYARLRVVDPLVELLRRRPRSYGYFLGHFAFLERDRADLWETGRELVAERLAQIAILADEAGARVILAMIPAPVQVCGPDQLAYYPRYVDLDDATRFDTKQPQRLTKELADDLGLVYYDLRPPLLSTSEACPYQPRNIHWTAAGHRAVASYLAEALSVDGYLEVSQ